MSSHRHIDANRRNLQFSGSPLGQPRTSEGQAVPSGRSRFSVLKSGIHPKAFVIPGEDPAALEAMIAGYDQEFAPTTSLQRFLVDSLIRADWLLQRFSRLEAALWAYHIEDARASASHPLDENAPLGDVYSRDYEPLDSIGCLIDSTERSYYRALARCIKDRRASGAALPEHGRS
jgi:hypothetical protein